MLVLSRREKESIVIGDSIKLTVLRTERGKVRIGIECPRSVEIFRGELWRPPVQAPPEQPAAAT